MIKKTAALLLSIFFFLSPLSAVITRTKVSQDKEIFYAYYDEKETEIAREKILKDGKTEFVYGFDISGEVKEIDDKGNVLYVWTFKGGKKNGPAYGFYPQGQKMYEFNYKDNVLSGTGKKFFEDGTLSEEVNYIDGKVEGVARTYLKNGNHYEYTYVNNKLNGPAYLYDKGNRLLESATYKNNVLDGPSKKYYLSGSLKSEMDYSRGKIEGYVKYYDEKGREISTVFYRNGKEMGKIQHIEDDTADGKAALSKAAFGKQEGKEAIVWQGPAQIHMGESKRMLNEIKFFVKKGPLNGVYRTYYKNGKVRYEGKFTDNVPSGTFKTYSPEGKVVAVDNYVNGRLSGVSRMYYASGEKLAEYRYRNGRLEGVSSVYDKDGRIITEASYRNNLMHGSIKVYYENGELCFEAYFSKGEPVGQLRYYFPYEGHKLMNLIEFKNGKISKSTAFSQDEFVEFISVY